MIIAIWATLSIGVMISAMIVTIMSNAVIANMNLRRYFHPSVFPVVARVVTGGVSVMLVLTSMD